MVVKHCNESAAPGDAENLDIFDFPLSTDELGKIDAMDSGATTYQSSPEMDQRDESFTISEA